MLSNVKLVAADIDGTILHGTGNNLSERVRASIMNAMPETNVALITGRSYAEVAPILRQLDNPGIWLGLGGGTEVRDPQGRVVSEVQISAPTLELFLSFAADYATVNLLGRNGWTDRCSIETIPSARAAVVANLSLAEAVELQEKCSRIFSDLYVSIGTDIDFAERFVVFLQPKNATKGEALRIIQENLGVATNETAAIGDMTLDVPMFERAYYSVAMGNAPEDVRRQARITVSSVENDGAAELFEAVFNGRRDY